MSRAGTVIMLLMIVTIRTAGVCCAADLKARAQYGASPHAATGDCSLCHQAAPEKLGSWFVLASTKRAMKTDLNRLCIQCHGSAFGHGTGKKPTINHAGLPLAVDGTITCAVTCHAMHIRAEDQKQQFYHLRLPFDDLCVSCHDN